MTIPTILPIELKTHIDAAEPVTIIDVRTPLEFQEVHAHGAVNIPLDELEAEKLSSFVNPESKTVYLICRSGGRGKACEKLLAKGPWQPINIEGELRVGRLPACRFIVAKKSCHWNDRFVSRPVRWSFWAVLWEPLSLLTPSDWLPLSEPVSSLPV